MSDELELYKRAIHVIDSACMAHGFVFDLNNPAKSLNDLILAEISLEISLTQYMEEQSNLEPVDDIDVMFELNG